MQSVCAQDGRPVVRRPPKNGTQTLPVLGEHAVVLPTSPRSVSNLDQTHPPRQLACMAAFAATTPFRARRSAMLRSRIGHVLHSPLLAAPLVHFSTHHPRASVQCGEARAAAGATRPAGRSPLHLQPWVTLTECSTYCHTCRSVSYIAAAFVGLGQLHNLQVMSSVQTLNLSDDGHSSLPTHLGTLPCRTRPESGLAYIDRAVGGVSGCFHPSLLHASPRPRPLLPGGGPVPVRALARR